MRNRTITIRVEGGIAEIQHVPPGCEYTVRIIDIQEDKEEHVQVTDFRSIYRHDRNRFELACIGAKEYATVEEFDAYVAGGCL